MDELGADRDLIGEGRNGSKRHYEELPNLTIGSSKKISSEKQRAKTSLRLKYEAEVEVVKRKLGDLEEMRKTLDLTQRKICQLLLVDPSAWTRWTKAKDSAPPHIYRMLQWYLALQEKYPALDANFWLSAVARVREPLELDRNSARTELLGNEQKSLRDELDQLKKELKYARGFENEIRKLERKSNLVLLVALALGLLIGLVIGLSVAHY